MRKKILSVMLSITMMAGLVACGGGSQEPAAGRQRAVRLLQKQQGITRLVS